MAVNVENLIHFAIHRLWLVGRPFTETAVIQLVRSLGGREIKTRPNISRPIKIWERAGWLVTKTKLTPFVHTEYRPINQITVSTLCLGFREQIMACQSAAILHQQRHTRRLMGIL